METIFVVATVKVLIRTLICVQDPEDETYTEIVPEFVITSRSFLLEVSALASDRKIRFFIDVMLTDSFRHSASLFDKKCKEKTYEVMSLKLKKFSKIEKCIL